MYTYSKEEAISRMNCLGVASKPFLFIIDYQQEQIYIEELAAIDAEECLYDFCGFKNTIDKSVEKQGVEWCSYPIPVETYAHSFQSVMQHIYAGNSYLVNLTCNTQVKTNLTLEEVFYRSEARYKLYLKDRFVVFSPEIFVRIKDVHIYSYPMKGTIDAVEPNACEKILNDIKETAEHATIVDLIRNDLSQVASRVTVPRYRYIDELHTNRGCLLQVSSEVRGELLPDWSSKLGDILFRLLPAGSITGAPKKKTIEIIAEAETYERGFYTGVMGYFDGESLDSAVMIRFLERLGPNLFFKSGGGITAQSDMISEYNEMKQKIYVPIY